MLVLDFDGTVTDAEQEGKPFREGYLADLAALTGHSLDDIRDLAARYEAEVAEDPDQHGWQFQGKIVAPASVDPYLRIMPVARKIFDHYGAFRDPDDRDRLLDAVLYRYNYQKTTIAFRDGAYELLSGLHGTAAYVVSNSHTEAIQKKIRALARAQEFDWLIERIHGRAMKYVIDEHFTDLPAELSLPGLARPVLLRRRAYHRVLSELVDREGVRFGDVLVAGDIFELDLALPLSLGARVALVINPFTPAYERAFVAGHERGHVIEHLSELPALL
jgi:hypothetical protein